MAGKKQPFDWDKFDSILQFGPTRQMCADIMGCSIDTIKRRVKDKHDKTFEQYLTEMFAPTRLKLQQKALSMALKGDRTMLIFSLKNKCGWSDQPDTTADDSVEGMEF